MAQDNLTAITPLDFSGMANLRAQARVDPGDSTLTEAAQQFEALFVQMMLKSMRDAVPQGGLFDSNSLGMYQEMHDQQIALDISRSGGLGLANMIEAQMQGQGRAGPAAEAGPELMNELPLTDGAGEK
jgi:flagellar protein FlgJ